MAEHEDKTKRFDLQSEIGMTRRDMLRRTAIVGGTLMWVAPAIQSIRTPAFASRQGPSPGTCAACFCWNGTADKSTVQQGAECHFDGVNNERFSSDACENFCEGEGFQFHEYCSGTNCACSTTTGVGGTDCN